MQNDMKEDSSVSAVADQNPNTANSAAARLGFQPGEVVQELGYDDDCDEELREGIADIIGGDLVDEDYDEVVDTVLLWHRQDDGDLFDSLINALTALADGGRVWLLTPKIGREGHVEPSEIGDVAPSAGLSSTSSISAGKDWAGTRLVSPKAGAKASKSSTRAKPDDVSGTERF